MVETIKSLFSELHEEHGTHIVLIMVLWGLPIFAYGIDAWTSTEAAKYNNEPIESHKLRKTITKAGEYWRFQLMALLFDVVGMILPWYNYPYASMVATLSILAIETYSVKENMACKNSGRTAKAMNLAEMLGKGMGRKQGLGDLVDVFGEINIACFI